MSSETMLEVNRIVLDGETYPAKCINVLHTDVHFSSRIPVYSTKGILRNPKVPVEKGLRMCVNLLQVSANRHQNRQNSPYKVINGRTG